MSNPDLGYIEVDCKHFDPAWLADHPNFPLAAATPPRIDRAAGA